MTTRKDILKINLIIVVNPTTYLWIFREFFFNGCRKLKRKTASSLILVGHVVFVLLIECRVIKGKIDLIFTWMFYRFRDHEYNELMPGGLNAHHFEFAFFMWSSFFVWKHYFAICCIQEFHHFFDSFIPWSCQDRISPYNFYTISTR